MTPNKCDVLISKVQFPSSRKYRTLAIPGDIVKALKVKQPCFGCWALDSIGEGLEREDIVLFYVVDDPSEAEAKLKKIVRLINE